MAFGGFGDILSNLFGGDGGAAIVSPEATQTAFQGFAPGGQMTIPDTGSSGFDWSSGFADLGKGLVKGAAPAIGGGLAGLAINQLMPGTPARANLIDPRQSQTIAGANMALDRARNLQQNPASFGLPGDPSDVNTPAGQKLKSIRDAQRSADAARGAFTTGGGALRESQAVNQAVGNEYNRVFQDTMGTLSGQTPMTVYGTPKKENPWAQMLAGAVSPAVSKGLSSLLAQWGMGA